MAVPVVDDEIYYLLLLLVLLPRYCYYLAAAAPFRLRGTALRINQAALKGAFTQLDLEYLPTQGQ
jgi:hypothetical protein